MAKPGPIIPSSNAFWATHPHAGATTLGPTLSVSLASEVLNPLLATATTGPVKTGSPFFRGRSWRSDSCLFDLLKHEIPWNSHKIVRLEHIYTRFPCFALFVDSEAKDSEFTCIKPLLCTTHFTMGHCHTSTTSGPGSTHLQARAICHPRCFVRFVDVCILVRPEVKAPTLNTWLSLRKMTGSRPKAQRLF